VAGGACPGYTEIPKYHEIPEISKFGDQIFSIFSGFFRLFCKIYRIPAIIIYNLNFLKIPAKFREICGEKSSINNFPENSAKFCKNPKFSTKF
jgi:hypothetical protein